MQFGFDKRSQFMSVNIYLTLEGSARESSMLLRLLIEIIELLKYLHQEPNKTEESINGRLPNAGKIAQ